MKPDFLKLPGNVIATAGKKAVIALVPVTDKTLDAWLKKKPASLRQKIEHTGFRATPGSVFVVYDEKGRIESVLCGYNVGAVHNDAAAIAESLSRGLNKKTLATLAFKLDEAGLRSEDLNRFCLGWILAGYKFDRYKKMDPGMATLVWPKGADRDSVEAHAEATFLIRNLINIPANDLGPDEFEKAARAVAAAEGLSVKVIKDKDLLKQNFPMIYNVGKGSPRRPRLIEMSWGNPKHPKVTLIGKGVCFDTGGLDLKPGTAMYTMKKDMCGASHAIALALLIIRHKIPVHVRVLTPVVENSISGESFRPSDVIPSRKGISVEVSDTDAEGRLVLGDALAYGSESKPAFMVNFATLTGGVALGPDLPAMFSNNMKMAFEIKDISESVNDPLWPLPLPPSYRRHMASDIADTCTVGNARGGTIHAALFLENFVDPAADWVHIDHFGWEPGGRPGRSRGGSEMGLRAIFAYIDKRFGKPPTKPKKKS